MTVTGRLALVGQAAADRRNDLRDLVPLLALVKRLLNRAVGVAVHTTTRLIIRPV